MRVRVNLRMFLVLTILLLPFSLAMENLYHISMFSYVDEAVALVMLMYIAKWFINRRLHIRNQNMVIILLFFTKPLLNSQKMIYNAIGKGEVI